jgi:hypothetical protein
MKDHVLVIISTGEREKALTGLMYATNALKHKWMGRVKVVIFGPSQRLALKDPEIQSYLKELTETLESPPFACKYIADHEGFSQELMNLGMQVVYVGTVISDYIKQGYIPMVF